MDKCGQTVDEPGWAVDKSKSSNLDQPGKYMLMYTVAVDHVHVMSCVMKVIIKNLFSMSHYTVNNGWTVVTSGQTVEKLTWMDSR